MTDGTLGISRIGNEIGSQLHRSFGVSGVARGIYEAGFVADVMRRGRGVHMRRPYPKNRKPPPKRPIAERFWEKVRKADGDGCWEWLAHRNARGYGTFSTATRVHRLAHRVAWELTAGELSADARVLHRCDNPACVRPSHLFIGTQADNVADMMQKGRGKKALGERSGMSKLTDDVVVEARSTGVSIPELARRVGVHPSTLWKARSGKSWKHI